MGLRTCKPSDARQSRRLNAIPALAFASVLSCPCALATNGDLDATFGVDSLARVGLAEVGAGNGAFGLTVQPDGKILICGTRDAGGESKKDMYVARFYSNGAPDTDFGSSGVATIDFNNGFDDCYALALQTDDKIVVAGVSQIANGDFAVARLTASGQPDPQFGGGDGKVTVAFDLGGNNFDGAFGVAIRTDHKIVVAGYSDTATHGNDFAVAQLLENGDLDEDFQGTGKTTIGFDLAGGTQDDVAQAFALDAQERIVVAGAVKTGASGAMGYDFAVARLLATGEPDTTFDGDGRQTIALNVGLSADDQAFALTIQRDGRIVIGGAAEVSPTGTPNYDMALVRLLSNGTPDGSFGGSGKVTIPFDTVVNGFDVGLGVTEQENGKLLLVGYSKYLEPSSLLGASARVNRDGTLDATFGNQGRKTYNLGLTSPSGQVLRGALFTDDGILASGGVAVPGGADGFVLRLQDDLIFASLFE